MFVEYDVVQLRTAATASGVPIGTLGTVLIIYPGVPPSYEVEFIADAGNSFDTFTMREQESEFVEKG